jgi:hypothetical protein
MIVSMPKIQLLAALGLVLMCSILLGQTKHTEVPLGGALTKALAKGSLTGEGAGPFHIRVEISEPENPQSPYQGTLEEWWTSPDQWHREVTSKECDRQLL